MERDSILYRARRKLQVIAYHCIPNDVLSKIYFRIYLKEKLDLKNPRKFNEKLQWLKLNYYSKNPLVIKCTDKYAARDYIEEKGFGHSLTKIHGVWKKTDEIEWDNFPEKFVLKCNHGCAYNIVCTDFNSINKNKVKKQLDKWLKENFAAFNVELHYGEIKNRYVICEEYLGDSLMDYKFFCFNGEPKFFYISSDLIHDRQAKIGFFDMQGNKIEMIRDDYQDINDIEIPHCYSEMVEMTKVLAADFPFVRIDFFVINDEYRFAEFTFTPGACMMPINPKKYDYEWGEMLQLPF